MENKKRIAIISEYTWDDPMTDMECAWYTHIDYIDVEDGTLGKVDVGTGFGRKLTDYIKDVEVVPMNADIKKMYEDAVARQMQEKAAKLTIEFKKEVEEYNNARQVQKVGQIVEIVEGKHKGLTGRISWMGNSQFKRSYRSTQGWRATAVLAMVADRPYRIQKNNFDLILVRPIEYGTKFENGKDKVYVDISKCRVIDGFEPVSFTDEQYEKGKKEAGIKDGETIYKVVPGVFGTKEGIYRYHEACVKLDESIKNECNPQEVYVYEYNNHECMFGYDGDEEAIKVIIDTWGAEVAKTIERFDVCKSIDELIGKEA